jgi:hypothetical protein
MTSAPAIQLRRNVRLIHPRLEGFVSWSIYHTSFRRGPLVPPHRIPYGHSCLVSSPTYAFRLKVFSCVRLNIVIL